MKMRIGNQAGRVQRPLEKTTALCQRRIHQRIGSLQHLRVVVGVVSYDVQPMQRLRLNCRIDAVRARQVGVEEASPERRAVSAIRQRGKANNVLKSVEKCRSRKTNSVRSQHLIE